MCGNGDGWRQRRVLMDWLRRGPGARERVPVALLHCHYTYCTTFNGEYKVFRTQLGRGRDEILPSPSVSEMVDHHHHLSTTSPPPSPPLACLSPWLLRPPLKLSSFISYCQLSMSLAIFRSTDEQAAVVPAIWPLHTVCPRPLSGVLAYAVPQGVLAWPVPYPSSTPTVKVSVAVCPAVILHVHLEPTRSKWHSIAYPARSSSYRRCAHPGSSA